MHQPDAVAGRRSASGVAEGACTASSTNPWPFGPVAAGASPIAVLDSAVAAASSGSITTPTSSAASTAAASATPAGSSSLRGLLAPVRRVVSSSILGPAIEEALKWHAETGSSAGSSIGDSSSGDSSGSTNAGVAAGGAGAASSAHGSLLPVPLPGTGPMPIPVRACALHAAQADSSPAAAAAAGRVYGHAAAGGSAATAKPSAGEAAVPLSVAAPSPAADASCGTALGDAGSPAPHSVLLGSGAPDTGAATDATPCCSGSAVEGGSEGGASTGSSSSSSGAGSSSSSCSSSASAAAAASPVLSWPPPVPCIPIIAFTMCNPPFFASAEEARASMAGIAADNAAAAAAAAASAGSASAATAAAGGSAASAWRSVGTGRPSHAAGGVADAAAVAGISSSSGGAGDVADAGAEPGGAADADAAVAGIPLPAVPAPALPPPAAPCTGTEREMWCPGGEVAFVTRMVAESAAHPTARCAVLWFSSMLGKFSSVAPVVAAARAHGARTVRTTELVQGRTRRWAVAWSFRPEWEFIAEGWEIDARPWRLPLPGVDIGSVVPGANHNEVVCSCEQAGSALTGVRSSCADDVALAAFGGSRAGAGMVSQRDASPSAASRVGGKRPLASPDLPQCSDLDAGMRNCAAATMLPGTQIACGTKRPRYHASSASRSGLADADHDAREGCRAKPRSVASRPRADSVYQLPFTASGAMTRPFAMQISRNDGEAGHKLAATSSTESAHLSSSSDRQLCARCIWKTYALAFSAADSAAMAFAVAEVEGRAPVNDLAYADLWARVQEAIDRPMTPAFAAEDRNIRAASHGVTRPLLPGLPLSSLCAHSRTSINAGTMQMADPLREGVCRGVASTDQTTFFFEVTVAVPQLNSSYAVIIPALTGHGIGTRVSSARLCFLRWTDRLRADIQRTSRRWRRAQCKSGTTCSHDDAS